MSFFGVPLSGLIASQSQLQAVSNNLANLDTVGFKDQNVNFSDVFAQSSLNNGSNDPVQTGLGVNASQTTSDFTDGAVSATGIASNMALTGNGFFVTKTATGATAYTRAGDFTKNSSGQLVTPSGDLVMGYPAANGVVNTSGELQPIQIGTGTVIPASATTKFTISANLNSSAAVGSTFASPTPVYDSLGDAHTLTVNYTKTGTNTWSYSVDLPTADTGAATTTVASGTLNFDTSGNLTSPTGSVAINVPTLTDGAASMNFAWNLTDSSGNPTLTQTSLVSANSTSTQNGNASGTLTGYSIAADGTVEGTFSNISNPVALGQVAVASFANTQGLLRTGNNDYQATVGSGAASVGTAETGGRGVITGGSVESSNVDVAAEFAKMIVAQQAYQANAKTVTTFDQISQATLQMITG
ncbi:flagellar hook protein FlgE [Granulicella tundricola]|uniref:Flagellar hook protein FlgE n=1 Tax=Granulicella tundricola (strain ATCC BAA-1859 / DSM 23138 / MP5ACTX9) TaxID=1198114 RepID=E8X636_GRATM|nr:flagellar hook protein FlgE [Granulicella tundricola]ADW70920.1 flagellar hook-basal body protein [Granulicella tundricola MP5ACTX9]